MSYFKERVGPALGGELDQDFWFASILQLSHQNSTVRNAVLAVSGLFEKPVTNALAWPNRDAEFSDAHRRQALKWYSDSLGGMSLILSQPQDQVQLRLALTSCILFACIEFQQMNVVGSLKLLMSGYNLLGQSTAKDILARDPFIRDVLLPIFVRQTVVLMLHGYSLPDGWLSPEVRFSVTTSFSTIESIKDARIKLIFLMLDGFSLMKAAYMPQNADVIAKLKSSQSTLLSSFEEWDKQLWLYVGDRYPIGMPPTQKRAVHLLQISALIASIWLSACTEPNETTYDDFTSQFTTILDHIESLLRNERPADTPFSFELRVIPALFFIGWRCRIPNVRRRALRLLSQAPAQEGLFHRDVAIWTVTRVIQIEEGLQEGTDVLRKPGIIPSEDARLRHIVVKWDTTADKEVKFKDRAFPLLLHSKWMLTTDESGEIKEIKTFNDSP